MRLVIAAVIGLISSTAMAQTAKTYLSSADGPSYEWPDDNTRVLVTSADTEGRFMMIDDRLKPSFTLPRHMHRVHSETFQVLEGSIEFTVGDAKPIRSGVGAMIFIPPGTPHSVRVLDDKPARVLVIYSPGGLEGYLESASHLSADQLADPRIMGPLDEKYDIVHLD